MKQPGKLYLIEENRNRKSIAAEEAEILARQVDGRKKLVAAKKEKQLLVGNFGRRTGRRAFFILLAAYVLMGAGVLGLGAGGYEWLVVVLGGVFASFGILITFVKKPVSRGLLHMLYGSIIIGIIPCVHVSVWMFSEYERSATGMEGLVYIFSAILVPLSLTMLIPLFGPIAIAVKYIYFPAEKRSVFIPIISIVFFLLLLLIIFFVILKDNSLSLNSMVSESSSIAMIRFIIYTVASILVLVVDMRCMDYHAPPSAESARKRIRTTVIIFMLAVTITAVNFSFVKYELGGIFTLSEFSDFWSLTGLWLLFMAVSLFLAIMYISIIFLTGLSTMALAGARKAWNKKADAELERLDIELDGDSNQTRA